MERWTFSMGNSLTGQRHVILIKHGYCKLCTSWNLLIFIHTIKGSQRIISKIFFDFSICFHKCTRSLWGRVISAVKLLRHSSARLLLVHWATHRHARVHGSPASAKSQGRNFQWPSPVITDLCWGKLITKLKRG